MLKMTRFLGKTLLKMEQFRVGIIPKPKYRIHLLNEAQDHMLCFIVIDGQDHGEEVYLYDLVEHGPCWLSELDFLEEEDYD